LIHTIKEAMKAHDIPSANWRTGKAGGAAQSESKGLSIGIGVGN
jgi:hypothetical protein